MLMHMLLRRSLLPWAEREEEFVPEGRVPKVVLPRLLLLKQK